MAIDAISEIGAREVLDSRGRPTVEAFVVLQGGVRAHASVPSGASTGRHEAVERRDGRPDRYSGAGVRCAVRGIRTVIAPGLRGWAAADQAGVDQRLIELDGTSDKSSLGSNAILAVSLGVARAAAHARGVQLWRQLGGRDPALLPLPMVNMLSGGLHARGGLDFQDLLIMPVGAHSFAEAIEMCVRTRDTLRELLAARGLSTLKADEGGFGPELSSHDMALSLLSEAVLGTGLSLGTDVVFACDVAASHLYDQRTGSYRLTAEGRDVDAAGLIDLLEDLANRYPIVSVEDPVDEDDWHAWQLASERLGRRMQLIGDDIFVTSEARLAHGIQLGVANAVLVKMNQVGTVTETIRLVQRAREAGYAPVISARSGETEDAALADLALATAAGQIKVGSVAQSDRLAKYNRLLRLEDELGSDARFAGPTGGSTALARAEQALRPRYSTSRAGRLP